MAPIAYARGQVDAHSALQLWLEAGLIDDAQADRLRGALEEREAGERSGRVIRFLVLFGAALIGMGLLLFIATHWASQSPATRLVLLFAAYVAVVAAATATASRSLPTAANGLWFLSTLVAIVNVFLIGQVFNLPLNYWQGAALSAAIAVAMGVATGMAVHGVVAVPFAILALAWIPQADQRVGQQAEALFEADGLRALLPVLGLAMIGAASGVAGTPTAFLGRALAVWGSVLVAGPIIVSTTHPEAFAWLFDIDPGWFHVVVIVLCVAVLGTALVASQFSLPSQAAAGGAAVLLLLLPQVSTRGVEVDSTSWLADAAAESTALFATYQLAILALAVGLVVLGRQTARPALVNVGMASIAIVTLIIYFTRVAGAMPISAAAVGGGALLVGIAIVLERKRRELLAGVTT